MLALVAMNGMDDLTVDSDKNLNRILKIENILIKYTKLFFRYVVLMGVG